MYVRVIGHLKAFQGKTQLVAFSIRYSKAFYTVTIVVEFLFTNISFDHSEKKGLDLGINLLNFLKCQLFDRHLYLLSI